MKHSRQQQPPAVAVAAACAECAQVIGGGEAMDSRPGCVMGIIHIGHVGELEAIGWVLTPDIEDPAGPPDIVCRHYHAKYWEDSHASCCGEDDGPTGEPTALTDGDGGHPAI
jgi:hypothetical protein